MSVREHDARRPMIQPKTPSKSISRRDFIRTAALVAGGVVLAGVLTSDEGGGATTAEASNLYESNAVNGLTTFENYVAGLPPEEMQHAQETKAQFLEKTLQDYGKEGKLSLVVTKGDDGQDNLLGFAWQEESGEVTKREVLGTTTDPEKPVSSASLQRKQEDGTWVVGGDAESLNKLFYFVQGGGWWMHLPKNGEGNNYADIPVRGEVFDSLQPLLTGKIIQK